MKYEDIKENAASGSTGAGSIAGNRGASIFSNKTKPMKRSIADVGKVEKIKFKHDSRRWKKVLRKSPFYSFGHFVQTNVGNNISGEPSVSENLNIQDVTSKLNAIGSAAKATNDNTIQFGLEDDQGSIVKIYVDAEHADEFEKAIASEMDSETGMSKMEIAELLFKLKDEYKIKNVVWPKIVDDAVEEEEASADAEQDMTADQELGDGMQDAESGNIDPNSLPAQQAPTSTGGGAEDALVNILSLLSADAEAKKAEAEARQAEARAKEAEAMARTAELKIRSEEQILDMEAHNKKESEQRGETRKLAKLAKYRHDLKRSAQGEMEIQQDLQMANDEKVVDIDTDSKTSEEEERANTGSQSISMDTLIKIVKQLQAKQAAQE